MAKTVTQLVDDQFENFRRMLLHQRTFMLSKNCHFSEAFIEGSFKNILDAFEQVHLTVKIAERR